MKKITLSIAAVLCAATPFASRADTSWIVKPAASTSGRMQLFTSRTDKPLPRTIKVDAPKSAKQFKSMRFGDKDRGFAFAGINTNGVAVAFIGAGPTAEKPNSPKQGEHLCTGSYAVGQMLRNCKNAKQAVEVLNKAGQKGYISGAMIFLIVDPDQAFIFEGSPRHKASYRLGLNYAVYTNVWKLPGMEDASVRVPKDFPIYAQREWVAKTGIIRARKGDRKVSVPEAIAVSRLNAADAKREDVASAPSEKNSIDAYLFEIDKKHPGILSCVFVAMGPQRHTVYLPVPLGAMDALPEELVSGAWAALGDGIARKAAPDDPVSDEIVELERCLHQEFNDVRYKAVQLLDEKKVDEAKALLRDTLKHQTRDVLKFMQDHK